MVVYKVDRLTRSLADFAKIVDVLDAHDASFVSVTQQFNTTTSMGRLTLNMLLSFAQFEREIAGERIRDKIAASKAKGMWMGGNVPLGYDVRERKLIVNEVEAETVRMIFRRYAELGSVTLLQEELDRQGVRSKQREGAGGRLAGGRPFSRGILYLSLLAGLIVDGNGHRMTPTHAVKKGRRYRYYVSAQLISGTRSDHSRGWRIPAGDIEGLILDRLRAFLASDCDLGEALSRFDLDASAVRSAMATASQLVEGWANLPPIKFRELVRTVVETITVDDERVVASLKPAEVATILLGEKCELPDARPPGEIELRIDAKLRRARKGIRLVVGGGVVEKPDAQIIALLREAHATRESLISGRDETIDAMSQRRGINRDILSAQMRLTYLAPDIVRALILARPAEGLTPAGLLSRCKDLPHDWQDQRAVLGLKTR